VARITAGSSAVLRFTLAGLLVTAALAAVTGVLAQRAGEHEATRSAEGIARVVATGVVAPALTPGLAAGDATAREALAAAVAPVLADGTVVRVKVWAPDGRTLWSDEPRLIGVTFPLDEEAREALESATVVSDITDLTRPENRFERGRGQLLEAYVAVHDTTGDPLVVEVYQQYRAVADAARETWWSFAPAALGALALLQAVQVPFAWRLARRLRRAQEAEARLLQAAVDASQAERRRIARDVHDGVVQDLTGLTFGLDAARLGGVDDDASGVIARTAAGLRRCVSELRRLLVDLNPPPLPEGGLEPALSVLAEGLRREGRQVTMRIDTGDGALPRPAAALLYRCALEAVRNVSAHSGAQQVQIGLVADGGTATLTVADDGVGFDEVRLASRSAAGHLGMRAMEDLLAESGGSLIATSTPGSGTRLTATVPLESAPALVGATR
jgi:two-component system NarL family sensor kinase